MCINIHMYAYIYIHIHMYTFIYTYCKMCGRAIRGRGMSGENFNIHLPKPSFGRSLSGCAGRKGAFARVGLYTCKGLLTRSFGLSNVIA